MAENNPYEAPSLPIERPSDWTRLLLAIDAISMLCSASPMLLFIFVRWVQPEQVSDQTMVLTGFAILVTIVLCFASGLYNLARAIYRYWLGYVGLALNALSGGLVLYLMW
jgi:hypothetical protein